MSRSVQRKLQEMNIFAFLVIAIGIATIIFLQTSKMEDDIKDMIISNVEKMYSLRLEVVSSELSKSYQELVSTIDELGLAGTDMAAEYEIEAKNNLIENLRKKHYSKLKDNSVYPFIVDKQSTVVMHPKLASGDISLRKLPFAKQMTDAKDPSFSYEYLGDTKMMFVKDVPEWGWVVAYAVMGNVVLEPVKDVEQSVTRLIKSLLTFVILISTVAVVFLGIFVARTVINPIKHVMLGLTESAAQVNNSSTQVSASNQSLSESATEQAASIEETSSSLEEMSSMTQLNARNAMQANTQANEARGAARQGQDAIAEMNRAIGEIQSSSNETAKIIKVIDEIAFQTNLLALNAAVEAARAGEAGKGFAVVADEVRNLAMRSGQAASETCSLIEGSVKSAESGVNMAGKVDEALQDIMVSTEKTTQIVEEMSTAAQEQAQGITQINQAITHMDQTVQSNAASAEESASAAIELSDQADKMRSMILKLRELVGGS